MPEHDITDLLTAAVSDVEVGSTPTSRIVTVARRRRRRVQMLAIGGATGLVAAVAVGIPVALDRSPAGPAGPAAGDCGTPVRDAVLPVWARGGFSAPEPRARFATGAEGRIVAIFFGPSLDAPPSPDHNNKILWVSGPSHGSDDGSRGGDPDLRIEATRVDSGRRVSRVVPGGPGPSIIDLPEAGCWHLSLHWGGRTDRLDLTYAPTPPAP